MYWLCGVVGFMVGITFSATVAFWYLEKFLDDLL